VRHALDGCSVSTGAAGDIVFTTHVRISPAVLRAARAAEGDDAGEAGADEDTDDAAADGVGMSGVNRQEYY
jgi:hypothetical protein